MEHGGLTMPVDIFLFLNPSDFFATTCSSASSSASLSSSSWTSVPSVSSPSASLCQNTFRSFRSGLSGLSGLGGSSALVLPPVVRLRLWIPAWLWSVCTASASAGASPTACFSHFTPKVRRLGLSVIFLPEGGRTGMILSLSVSASLPAGSPPNAGLDAVLAGRLEDTGLSLTGPLSAPASNSDCSCEIKSWGMPSCSRSHVTTNLLGFAGLDVHRAPITFLRRGRAFCRMYSTAELSVPPVSESSSCSVRACETELKFLATRAARIQPLWVLREARWL
mmetsp:Transcript_52347/g.147399  ORF Transcript_52347/g.147399 Transcript_52347/m.147399 type:complete len:279 (+) Transcript_52347:2648-3484(+)